MILSATMVWLTKDLEGVEMVQKLAEELQRQVEPFDLDETACQILIFATALETKKKNVYVTAMKKCTCALECIYFCFTYKE